MYNKSAPQYLYRLFDRNGALLYVGVSANIVERLQRGHASGSPWKRLVYRMEAERVGGLDRALRAERRAISDEAPVYNVLKRNGKEWDEIIRLRKNGETLAAIGKKFDISRQRVHQILAAAIKDSP